MSPFLGCLGTISAPCITKMTAKMEKKFEIIRHYDDNMNKLKQEVDQLKTYKSDFDNLLELRLKVEGKQRAEITKKWLDDVNGLLDDEGLKELIEEIDEVNNNKRSELNESSFGFGVIRRGMCHRYESSRRAEKMVSKAQKIWKERPMKDDMALIIRALTVDEIKSMVEDYKSYNLDSRNKHLDKQVKRRLLDDQVEALGIYGDDGVGKTTIIKRLLRDTDVRMKFAKHIVWVEVSENPNMKDIQNKIKERISKLCTFPFEWRDRDNVELRAVMLYVAMMIWRTGGANNQKILLVLDHVEGKVDLSKLGNLDGKNFFKIVVVSRTKEVCELMGASEYNSFEMTPLIIEEAKCLFWRIVCNEDDKVVDQVTNWDCLKFGEHLLNTYCKGLPFVVTALAKALKNKTFLQWKKFEKDVLLNNSGNPSDDLMDLLWKQSIKCLKDTKEKESFFYLTCLFSPESSINIVELIRYAMGLDLIQHVDNLTQATTLANTWIDQLISDSMLEDDDDDEIGDNYKSRHVKLHHFARKSTMSMLEKDETQMFWVKNIHRWVTKETLQEYSRISLMKDYDHSYLNGIESNKLQILILDNSKPSDQFSDKFFEGMMNLKVLVLKGMTLKPCLPKSITMLKKLKTLHLEDCKLENIGYIGELENLVVLSLHKSKVTEFPAEELKSLGHLRILDLSKCEIPKKAIPAKVLPELHLLEGLYLYRCCEKWGDNVQKTDVKEEKSTDNDSNTAETPASIDELNALDHLNVLEIKVDEPQHLPENDQFVKKLDQFYVCVGSGSGSKLYSTKNHTRVLDFGSIDVSSITKYSCLKKLVEKTEFLRLCQVMGEVQRILQDEEHLKDEWKRQQRSKFPYLQKLLINKCSEMQPISSTRFSAPNLIELRVSGCDKLKFLFLEHADDQVNNKPIKFHHLTLIEFTNLQSLESVSGKIDSPTSPNNDVQGQHQALFNGKIIFPYLEELGLQGCNQIVKLWDVRYKEEYCDYHESFKKLKRISLANCANLKGCLASLSLAVESLKKVDELRISNCPQLEEVITEEETGDDHQIIEKLFPRLVTLVLEECPGLQMFLSAKNQTQKLHLPSLRILIIKDCPKMQSFSSGDFKAPKLKYATVNDKQLSTLEIEAGINSFLQTCFQDQHKPREGRTEGQNRGEDQSYANKSEIQEDTN